jgi:hypothetical protein
MSAAARDLSLYIKHDQPRLAVQVDPGDVVMLVLSWHWKAGTMCEYSREEFVNGMLRMRCDSVAKLQQKLPELRQDLQDAQKYKASRIPSSTCCRSEFSAC